MNEAEVYFGLFGDDFDPNAITAVIGIDPSRIMRKSNPIPKRSSWQYSSGKFKDEIVDVYKITSSLVARLAPHADNIVKAKNDYELDAVLEVVLTITPDEIKSAPAIGFNSEVIAFLHKVGATIDIDTYRGES